MSREQLAGLLLEAYEARKETREYFEFFLNPDVGKLSQKYEAAIAKEFARVKRRYCRARMSNVKAALRDFASFQPGDEKRIDFPEALIKSVAGILVAALNFADKALLADRALAAIDAILSDTAAGTLYFRRSLADYL